MIWNQLHLCHPLVYTPRHTFPSLPFPILPALTALLSVIPGTPLLRGPQACQTSSSPSKKYPSSCHNPPVPPLPHPHLPYLTPIPLRLTKQKIKSHWWESGQGSCFADQSVDIWLSLTGWTLNPIVSLTGLLSVFPLSLWLRAGEKPD